jgi:hypothetical protein
MKPNTYAIVRRALEEGALSGLNRSNKHVQAVDPTLIDRVAEAVVEAQMSNLSEMFFWPSEQEEKP